MTVFNNFAQCADNVRLELKVHRQVRIVPITDNAHALKVLALVIHLLGRVLTAFLTKLGRCHLVTRLAHLLLDVELDRQTMAVPAGNVRRVKP